MTHALAAAQSEPAPTATPTKGQEMFVKADTNHDGVLSLDEWKAAGRRERGFGMIDTNGDGKVTSAELKAAMAKYGRGG